MKLIEVNNFCKRMSIQSTLDGMTFMFTDPESPLAFRTKTNCHYNTAKYAFFKARNTDRILLLGKGDTVFHSIVVDESYNIVFDFNSGGATYDKHSETYSLKNRDWTIDKIAENDVMDFKQYIKRY